MVTVSAPNSPCRHTHTKVALGHQGDTGTLRRRAQAVAVITRISTPTAVAR